MHALSTRILHAVSGDATAIQSLASAIAASDADTVHSLLSARGLPLEPAELSLLMTQVGQGDDAAAYTFTFTFT